MARVTAEGLEGDWRRPVFPTVREFVDSEIGDRDYETVAESAFQMGVMPQLPEITGRIVGTRGGSK